MSQHPKNLAVCFDEAGNTGQHLTDPNQPVFTTAGAFVSDEDLAAIRDLLEWRRDEELHFSVLKRSRSGRGRIISLCQSEFASTRVVKAFAIHKAYMVTTKIIDMLMESLAYEYGLDMYERGGHLATANLFHSVGPVFCGRGLYDQMVARFVEMIDPEGHQTRLRAVAVRVDVLLHLTDGPDDLLRPRRREALSRRGPLEFEQELHPFWLHHIRLCASDPDEASARPGP